MEEKINNKYVLGCIGALLGAFIGTVPWILIYVFGNMMIAIVSVLIAIGSYWGYKLTRATIDKKLPIIITVSSLIAITVATFGIIPVIIFKQENIDVTFENLKLIYGYSGFIRDYVISIVFTILGISGTVSNLHKQIKAGVAPEELKIAPAVRPVTMEEAEKAKDIFSKYNAFTKESGLSKEEVMDEFSKEFEPLRAEQVFYALTSGRAIKSSQGKFYFNEKKNLKVYDKKRAATTGIITLVIVGILTAVIIIVAIATSPNRNKNKNKTNNTTINSSISNSNTTGLNNITEQYETEHEIEDLNVKFVPPKDMLILTDSEIELYMGEGYSSLYEIVAMNESGSKLLYCFRTKLDENNNYTSEEYLKDSLKENKYEEIKKETLGGLEFYIARIVHEDDKDDDGNKYTELCCVHKYEKGYLCIDYWYVDGKEDATKITDMFVKTK